MTDNDGIDDALRSATQVAAGLVARAAELQARERETAARQQEHQFQVATADAARRAVRAGAEQQAALARLALVHDPAWWQSASASDIAHSWTIASSDTPSRDTAAAIGVMRRELAHRYNLAPDTRTTADELQRVVEAVSARQQQANREHSHAASERTQARNLNGSAGVEQGRAGQAELGRDRRTRTRASADSNVGINDSDEGRDLAGRADQGYDSAEQRESRARHYEASGNARAAEARRVADTAQGVSAIYATTTSTKGRRRRGRRATTRGPRDAQRNDRGR